MRSRKLPQPTFQQCLSAVLPFDFGRPGDTLRSDVVSASGICRQYSCGSHRARGTPRHRLTALPLPRERKRIGGLSQRLPRQLMRGAGLLMRWRYLG